MHTKNNLGVVAYRMPPLDYGKLSVLSVVSKLQPSMSNTDAENYFVCSDKQVSEEVLEEQRSLHR